MYVSISKTLTDNTKNQIRSMQDREINTLVEPQIKLLGNEEFIDNLVWGKHLGLKYTIPQEWKSKTSSLNLQYEYEPGKSHSMTLHCQSSFETPPEFSRYEHIKLSTEDVPAFLLPMSEYLTTKREINERWGVVRKQVISFLEAAKSLNEALKLWPDLAHYIDKASLAKVATKVTKTGGSAAEPSRAAEMLKSMDTEGAIAAVIVNRMIATT